MENWCNKIKYEDINQDTDLYRWYTTIELASTGKICRYCPPTLVKLRVLKELDGEKYIKVTGIYKIKSKEREIKFSFRISEGIDNRWWQPRLFETEDDAKEYINSIILNKVDELQSKFQRTKKLLTNKLFKI